jgi:uncharacterized protein
MRRNATHIAVFCKAPVEGRVKTRLIAAYGAKRATTIYRELVGRTLRVVVEATSQMNAEASLWVADDVNDRCVAEWGERFSLPMFQQAEGDLGMRMSHCLHQLGAQFERVLLIGTDCTAFTAAHLIAASNALSATHPWVFIPAEDGGYVLVGTTTASATPFQGIAWSTPQVMLQTREALTTAGLAWHEMPMLWDVDTPADVEQAVAAGLLPAP